MGKTFEELVGSSKFDSFYKNGIRDYYAYGFKANDEFRGSSSNLSKRWSILKRILNEKWYFDGEKKGGRKHITLKTGAEEADNPLDEMYFLHLINCAGDYLNILLDLDQDTYIRGGTKGLDIPEEFLEMQQGTAGNKPLSEANSVEYAILQNWYQEIQSQKKSTDEKTVRLNKQLDILRPDFSMNVSDISSRYKTISNRCKELQKLGVLSNLKNNPDERNAWIKKQWKKCYHELNRSFNNNTAGDDYWYKVPVTMGGLKDIMEKNQENPDQLQDMFKFFAQYYTLGEVGTFLSKRYGTSDKGNTCFRYKYNYIQKSLYDYNFIDILVAIENQYLCHIEYSHGINPIYNQIVVVPLEIRISVVNGREYVMCYDIKDRCIRALRMEFIDAITFYPKDSTVEFGVIKDGKKLTVSKTIDSNPEDLDRQLKIASEMLTRVWGTEITDCYVTADWRESLTEYTFEFKMDEEKESYIGSRLKKESRHFWDDYSPSAKRGRCFSTKELRAWIRSYYGRVLHAEQLQDDKFNLRDDVDSMWKLYNDDMDVVESKAVERKQADSQACVSYGFKIKGKEVIASEDHTHLFHELFSRYMLALATAIMDCAGVNGGVIETALQKEFKKEFPYYDGDWDELIEEQAEYLKNSNLMLSDGKTRFVAQGCDYLQDILPLTKVEVRWLMTVLHDPLCEVFLNRDCIQQMQTLLQSVPYEAKPYPFSVIHYFDRYEVHNIGSRQVRILRSLYQAMKENHPVKVRYFNWKKKPISVQCKPVWLEYSRKDHEFRLWYINHDTNVIHKVNVSRIQRVEIEKGKQFDLAEERREMQNLYEKTMTEIRLEFYQGNRNLPDRILTEFSPWKKKCIYDSERGIYRLRIDYSTMDEKDILIRILKYGPYVKVTNDNYIKTELQNRIKIQRDLLQDVMASE